MIWNKVLLLIPALLLWAGAAFGAERITVPLADAPARGPVAAPVTIIEFLDFQ